MAEEKVKRKSSKRLTQAEWGQIIALYKSGEYTQKRLAEMYGITSEAVCRKLKKEGGAKVRGEDASFNQEAVQEMVKEKIITEADEIARKFNQTKDNSFKYMTAAERLAYGVIEDAVKNKRSLASIKDDLKAIESAVSIFSKARQEKYTILGAKDGDLSFGEELPDLQIVGMDDARVAEIIANSEGDEFDDDFGSSDPNVIEHDAQEEDS